MLLNFRGGLLMDKKTTGIVSYITLIGWLIAFCAGDKEGAKFHLNQSLVLYLASLINSIIISRIPICKNPALRFMTQKPGFFFCAQTCLLKQAVCYLIRFSYTSTVILSKCQISSTYSWIVRSDENLPACAIFKIALFAQPSSSLYASMTRFCASA